MAQDLVLMVDISLLATLLGSKMCYSKLNDRKAWKYRSNIAHIRNQYNFV